MNIDELSEREKLSIINVLGVVGDTRSSEGSFGAVVALSVVKYISVTRTDVPGGNVPTNTRAPFRPTSDWIMIDTSGIPPPPARTSCPLLLSKSSVEPSTRLMFEKLIVILAAVGFAFTIAQMLTFTSVLPRADTFTNATSVHDALMLKLGIDSVVLICVHCGWFAADGQKIVMIEIRIFNWRYT